MTTFEVSQLTNCLSQTLDPQNRKQAEQNLSQIENSAGFGPSLLKIMQNEALDRNIRFASAVYFKNFIKRKWDEDMLSPHDKEQIKQVIVTLMISSPVPLQLQLSEAVTLIAESDFPEKWQSLLQDLISKLSIENLQQNVGVLQTAHSIFKRWRSQFETNALYTEINYVMKEFAPAYLAFFQAIDGLITQNQGNEILGVLFESLLLLVKIFYSLNSQDLPEFFEDNMGIFMGFFQKYLQYPPLAGDDDEAGVLEKIKAVICEILEHYATRFEADFKMLPVFVEVVWNLLTTTGLQPRNDVLVSKAISFLTAVVRHERHKGLFENEGVLSSICSQVILPNMMLRESDEELFEDDPIEYIRRDLEGSDSDTRRRASADLVRGLLTLFEKQVTEIFSGHISSCLSSYQQDVKRNWKAKDTALYLITSLSAKTLTSQSGATSTNEYIQILPVFAEHIIPDLQAPVDGSIHPIVKVDAIKYLMVFRNQLTKEQLMEVLPSLITHLGSSNYVVNTYAAHCIERILAIRIGNQFLFNSPEIKQFQQHILERLFSIIVSGRTSAKIAENDYLMKTALRVILTAREELLSVAPMLLERLTFIMNEISKNPSNPKFNHYAFESVSAVVKYVCHAQPTLVKEFENSLGPAFEDILRRDVLEFTPYVFQIYAQLLELHTEGVPAHYMTLLAPLLQPHHWENQGNVPALVNFFSSFLKQDSAAIVKSGYLQAFLGVFQKLLASKMNDHHGLELLSAIFEYVPMDTLKPFIKNAFVIIFTRLFQSKTAKLAKAFLSFIIHIFLLENNLDDIIAEVDSIQANPLFPMLVYNILIPEFANLDVTERKSCVIAMSKALTRSQRIQQDIELWTKLLTAVLTLFTVPTGQAERAENYELEYQPSFYKLQSATKKQIDVDHEKFFAESILRLVNTNPPVEQIIKNNLAPDMYELLMTKLK